MSFFTALQFLTAIPVPDLGKFREGDTGRSTVFFPVVGLVIGLILAGLNRLFLLFLPPEIGNGLTLAALVLITGAMHLDGFIDTCDGMGGHKPVEERWKVMHDSRAGAFGVVGAVLLLLIKFLALNSIPAGLMTATLILVPVVSRWAMVYAVMFFRYARPEGLGKSFKTGTSAARFIIATLFSLGIAVGCARLAGADFYFPAGTGIMITAWLVVLALGRYLSWKFAGLTGDSYGAINEIIETVLLILITIPATNGWLGL